VHLLGVVPTLKLNLSKNLTRGFKVFKCESSKCRCIKEVPSNALRCLHWPWNQVCWWIVPYELAACLFAAKVICYWCWWTSCCMISLSSHVDDDAVESCWWLHYRGDLVATRCKCRVMLATVLSSHVGDSAAEATWSRRDIVVKSYWWQCYVDVESC
jgi:hypothetical protein